MNAVVIGMLGPLLVAGASWVLMVRTFRRDPSRLTPVMMAAFAGKMAFFAAYVIAAMTVWAVAPGPFAASFATSFIALYAVEAVALRRLLRSR
jgi:hypothetical protein